MGMRAGREGGEGTFVKTKQNKNKYSLVPEEQLFSPLVISLFVPCYNLCLR